MIALILIGIGFGVGFMLACAATVVLLADVVDEANESADPAIPHRWEGSE